MKTFKAYSNKTFDQKKSVCNSQTVTPTIVNTL